MSVVVATHVSRPSAGHRLRSDRSGPAPRNIGWLSGESELSSRWRVQTWASNMVPLPIHHKALNPKSSTKSSIQNESVLTKRLGFQWSHDVAQLLGTLQLIFLEPLLDEFTAASKKRLIGSAEQRESDQSTCKAQQLALLHNRPHQLDWLQSVQLVVFQQGREVVQNWRGPQLQTSSECSELHTHSPPTATTTAPLREACTLTLAILPRHCPGGACTLLNCWIVCGVRKRPLLHCAATRAAPAKQHETAFQSNMSNSEKEKNKTFVLCFIYLASSTQTPKTPEKASKKEPCTPLWPPPNKPYLKNQIV